MLLLSLSQTSEGRRCFSPCCGHCASILKAAILLRLLLTRHPGGRFASEPERFSAMLLSLPSDLELVALDLVPTELCS